MRYTFKIGEEQIQVAPRSLGERLVLSIGESEVDVIFDHQRTGRCTVQIAGQSFQSWVARDGDDIYLKLEGSYYKVSSIDPRSLAAAGSLSEGSVVAPMPGVVVEVLAAEGDVVSQGARLMTIESMKLQSAIAAPCSGVVKSLRVEAGSEFNKDDVLVEIETE